MNEIPAETLRQRVRRWAIPLLAVLLLVALGLAGWGIRQYFAAPSGDPRAFRTVIIDAGHGGEDSGAMGNGLLEKNLTLDLALQLADLLQAKGLHVVLTRHDDHFISLSERARIANREPHSIFVSIHFNQTDDRAAQGIETWQASAKSGNPADDLLSFLHLVRHETGNLAEESLAGAIQGELITATGGKDRGLKRANFYVVRHVRSPAVLVECGFISNPATAQKLRSKIYRHRLAGAIADGILKYRDGWKPIPTLMAQADGPRGG